MNEPTNALGLLREVKRRDDVLAAVDATLFAEQKAFVYDTARFRAAQCGRRAGKTFTVGSALVRESELYPGCNLLFIATTLKHAKRILLKDVLGPICRKLKIHISTNRTEGVVQFPNGTTLYLMGMDASKEESDKVLGVKLRAVVIDEGASYKQDLTHVVFSSIVPTLADTDGWIAIVGTTGNNTNNLFYDIVGRPPQDPKHQPGWSIHRWNWTENPHMKDKVQRIISDLKSKNPLIETTKAFRQMYNNEWVIEDDWTVYKYKKELNFAPNLPEGHEFRYCLGVDLGYEDDTAFIVGAYSQTDPNLYYVEAYKEKHLTIDKVAAIVKRFENRYKFARYVIDGSSKQAVEELKARYKIPFEASDKTTKAEHIEIMNGDFQMGHIKALPGCNILIDEWQRLVWDRRTTTRRVEDGTCPNHCADGALYVWRMSYHYAWKAKRTALDRNTDEYMEQLWKKEAQEMVRAKKRNFWERDWGKEFGRTRK